MIFLLNVIISCSYLCSIKNIKKINIMIFFPIIVLWTFILGFQYAVGTDYFNYLRIYNSELELDLYCYKKEFIFFYFIKILKIFFLNGQIFFIAVSFIENLLFYCYLKLMVVNNLINKKRIYIYIFLFLCFGTNFYNQMNGIRQYFNIYLLSISMFYIYNKNFVKYLLVFLIGMNIHRSFFLVIPLYLFRYISKYFNQKKLKIVILLAFFINFLPVIEIIKIIISYIPRYSHYINSDYFQEIPITQKITKFIFLPYYFWSCSLINKENNLLTKFMLKIGIISYGIKLACLKLTVTNRLGEYFTLLAIYPIYLILDRFIQKKSYFNLILLIGTVFGLFIIKVIILPKGEYLYASYLFN